MSLAGEEKEMRLPSGTLGYHHSLDQNTDQGGGGNHVQLPPNIQDHEKSPAGGGGCGGATPPYGGGGSSKFNKTTTTPRARYRECLKNHAANIGGNVTDGCGEFMPSGEEGTLEALKCAACNCHRNFHRKDQPTPNNVVVGGDNINNNSGIMVVHPLQLPQPLPSPIPSLNHHHHHQHSGRSIWASMPPQPVKMAFAGSGGSGATDSSSEELNFNTYHHQQATSVPPQPQPPFALAKKRFRTKFSQEQKDRMLEFAEKLGWRIPREDDTEVQRFCSQVGVKRQVFKVWMHNNKNPSSAKKNTLQEDQQP